MKTTENLLTEDHLANVVQNILPKRSTNVRAISGTVFKAVDADTTWKVERGMGSTGGVQAAKIFRAPPSWEHCFSP